MHKLGFSPSADAAVFPSDACRKHLPVISLSGHTQTQTLENVQQLQLWNLQHTGNGCLHGEHPATEPCPGALARWVLSAERVSAAAFGRDLVIYWKSRGKPALGCVSELPAGSQGWDGPAAALQLWPYPAWEGAGGGWGSLMIFPKGFGVPPEQVLCWGRALSALLLLGILVWPLDQRLASLCLCCT